MFLILEMSDTSMEEIEKEFAPFLNPAARGDIKNIAIDYFLGMTGKEDGKQAIVNSNVFLDGIISLTSDIDTVVSSKAYKALTNIATDESCCKKITKSDKFPVFIRECFKRFLDPRCEQADSVCKFVSNLSRSEESANSIVKYILSDKDIGISKMVNAMCNLKYNSKANLHFMAPLLANLSQITQIRQELMTEKEYVIQRCLPFLSFEDSIVRRGGVASLIKNCCFDTGNSLLMYCNQILYM